MMMYSPRTVTWIPYFTELLSILDILSKMSRRNRRRNNASQNTNLPIVRRPMPSAVSTRVVARAPTIRSTPSSTVICGHEQIATVSGSVSFSATKYSVNPGLSTYTWLSNQAEGWEKYRFRKLQFVYVPAEANTSTAGSVYLAADYDPTDAAPASLAAMSTYETQSNGRVWEAVPLELSRSRMFDGVQTKKIRCGPVGGDLQLYDAGSVSLCTVSCADTSAIGQLWVYYEIEFVSQQTEPSTKVPPSLVVRNLSANQTFTSTVAAALDFDEAIVSGFDVTDTSGVYTVPCGSFKIYGEIGCQDTSAETLQVLAELLVDGAVVSPPQNAQIVLSAAAGGLDTLPFFFYASFSSQSTIQIRVTMTGAAGTLSATQDTTRLFIEAV